MLGNVGLNWNRNQQESIITHAKKYTHPPFDIYLLGRICKEGEVDRNTSQQSVPVPGKQALGIGRSHWLLALATTLSRSFPFAEAILAVVLFVLALAIVFILVLAGKPVALHLWCLWCLWCRLLTTQTRQNRLQVWDWVCLRCSVLIRLAHSG